MLTNKKGMTLLEVLLAITILSIVLASFLTLFPQIAMFNAKTDEKLSAMYLANEKIVVLNDLVKKNTGIFAINESDGYLIITNYSKTNSAYAPLNLSKDVELNGDYFVLYTEDEKIQSKIEIDRRPEPDKDAYTLLYRIHVEVQNTQLNEVSSIYGYLSIPNTKE